jgi:hypothetical protein
VCVLAAAARDFDNAFEWAPHEPAALRAGARPETIQAIKLRPSAEMPEPFGSVVELIRGAALLTVFDIQLDAGETHLLPKR